MVSGISYVIGPTKLRLMNEKKAITKHYLCAMNNRGQVRAKKHLGQHFLKDESIAERIANVVPFEGVEKVLEIGPGMGVMTKYLLDNPSIETWVVEIDDESVSYLKAHYNTLSARILEEDFLRWNPSKTCLLYTSPSPRDLSTSRMPSSA